MRVEDTDRARSKKEYEENMLACLKWLDLDHVGQILHQSERTEVYKNYLNKLIDEDKAYVSEEIEGENREVVRFRNPKKLIKFIDLIRGEVEFDTTELEDFIIARNINEPVYHLAVVVDDFESEVTHIIRGEDHISNTPRQILIQEALGMPRPQYAHLPLILAPDRSKLSKRKHGESVSLDYYRNKGYLPEAIINYLALLGWNPGTDQEIFTMEELIEQFDLDKIQKGGAIFDEKKLDWINKEHIKRLPEDVQREMKLKEVGDLPYIKIAPNLDAGKICWKEVSKEDSKKHLERVKELAGDDAAIMEYATTVGKGNVLWPLRYALSGEEKSPDPFTLMAALGKDESVSRIQRAIDLL